MAKLTKQEVHIISDLTYEMNQKVPLVGRHRSITVSTRQIARWSDALTKLLRESSGLGES